MKNNLKFLSILFIISFLRINLFAQYGPQFDNRGFEQWTNRVSEPTHWHSSGTADGDYSGFLPDDLIESSTQTRPGSTGSKSVRLVPKEVGFLFWTYTANGNLTNGRMNAGSTSTTGEENYMRVDSIPPLTSSPTLFPFGCVFAAKVQPKMHK